MSKVTKLAEECGITSGNVEKFAAHLYHDGYSAKIRNDDIAALRDHFAGLAMQTLYSSNVEWEPTGAERTAKCEALIKELVHDAYQMADAMLAERGKSND